MKTKREFFLYIFGIGVGFIIGYSISQDRTTQRHVEAIKGIRHLEETLGYNCDAIVQEGGGTLYRNCKK